MKRYTYFLSNNINDLIKIGFSVDIEKRIQNMTSTLPFVEIECLFYIEGDYELDLHKHFKDKRIMGEWFDIKGITKDQVLEILVDLPAKCPQSYIKTLKQRHIHKSYHNYIDSLNYNEAKYLNYLYINNNQYDITEQVIVNASNKLYMSVEEINQINRQLNVRGIYNNGRILLLSKLDPNNTMNRELAPLMPYK